MVSHDGDDIATAHVNPTVLGRGLAALRIFVGIILFANGLSKITGQRNVVVGWYHGSLITRPEARQIIDYEVNKRNKTGTAVPFLKNFANDIILPHWNTWQWIVTFIEVGVGALLILGFITRGAALAGLCFHLFLALVYATSNRWMFEQPHEYVPLLILAIVPAGRYWGIDGMLLRWNARLRRWPF